MYSRTGILHEKDFFHEFQQNIDDIFLIWNLNGQLIDCTLKAARFFGYTREELLDLQPQNVFRKKNTVFMALFQKGRQTEEQSNKKIDTQTVCLGKQGNVIPVRLLAFKLKLKGEEVIFSIFRDLSHQLKTKKQLQKYEQKLKRQRLKVKQLQTALREVSYLIPKERKRIKVQIQTAIERQLIPLLEKLKDTIPHEADSVQLLENTIKEFTTIYGGKIAPKLLNLTPKELRICNLIRQGYATKEIAAQLNLSFRTVENHRNSIRKKLGIIKQNANLSTFLKSILLDN